MDNSWLKHVFPGLTTDRNKPVLRAALKIIPGNGLIAEPHIFSKRILALT